MTKRDKHNKLEQTQNRLNARGYQAPDAHRRSGFSEDETTVRRSWDEPYTDPAATETDSSDEAETGTPNAESAAADANAPEGAFQEPAAASSQEQAHPAAHSRVSGFFHKLFFVSIAFFVIAVATATALFLTGSFFVSGENVAIRVEGPISVGSAEESSFDIIVANSNDVALTDATLTIEYPEGARESGDLSRAKQREVAAIGTVGAGQQVRATIDVSILGQADATTAIDFMLEYGVENSNATFVREVRHELLVTSSPIDVSVTSPTEINSNQPVTFEVTIRSNAHTTLYNIMLAARYPFGFTPQELDPEPREGGNVWEIGRLEPEEERVIRITGPLQAETNEQRTFTFVTGIGDAPREEAIIPVLDESQQTLSVNAPYLDLSARFNNTDPDVFTGRVGREIEARVSWMNNLNERVADMELIATFGGNAFSRESVVVPSGGFYRSSNNEVVWNQSTNRRLSTVDAGERVSVNFEFGSISGSRARDERLENPHITVDLEARGDQFTDSRLPQTIRASHSFLIKLNTEIGLSGHAIYSDGPFVNTGPVPLAVDRPTTLTIVLNATNAYNNVEGAVYTARLPIYVEWEGNTTDDGALTYNANTRELRWDIGDLASGSGFSREAELAAFQVSVTPSLSQVRSIPAVLTDGLLRGRDTYTGNDLDVTISTITTDLSVDPQHVRKDGEVRSQ
ncbi:MAG: hypothetical protein WD049_07775 [Candidatus Paceibacterota bacterium]